ncbi:type II secretion system protein [Pontibacterium sp. N1Y112]|uniref:Type II secretion system protein n=1 Tax=Pontibacterium sinense TaxID=2781979 RepID=A0A8J7FG94_9GAMM|nr:type II secretion system protein [Pontibacterium sinense]MBE9396833.1 type II secretion system protein [Pontibacterium sinense]
MMARVANAGFTLVELVITITVTSIALVAIIYGWSIAAKHSADVTWQARTAYIGQTYLEEILTKRFDENSTSDGRLPCGVGVLGGDTMPACTSAANFGSDGEARANFDDVDDYHGLTEVPLSLLNNIFTGNNNPYGNYSVAVAIAYDTTQINVASMVKRITVTVTPPGNLNPVVFSAYKGNY